MNVVVNISEETINKCTESSITSELIDCASPTTSTLSLGKCCRGFTTKALEFILDYTKAVGNVQEVKLMGKSDRINYVTLKNTKETAQFFDTFKRLGINIGTLVVGYTNDFKTLYVSEKIVKDLKRHAGTETLSAIAMYLITLAYFFANIYSKRVKYVTDAYARRVQLDKEFLDCLYSFRDSEYCVDIRGIASEDFESITWYLGSYSAYEYNMAPSAIQCNYNVVTTEKGKTCVILEYNMSANPMYYQIFDNGAVLTNMDLSYFELQGDSITRAVLPRTSKTAMMLCGPLKDSPWTVVDPEEAPDWARATLADLMLRMELNEGISKTKAAALGVTINGSSGGVDPAAMKDKYADDEYAQQLYAQAQPYYDTFDLGNLTNLLLGFSKGDVYAMMFTGESGTGKSTSARVIPYKCGIPYISVNFSVNIEESDLFGSMIPNPTKKDASEPEFIWQDGIITKAIRNGYCAILEEINFARPGVLGKLNSLLDENRQIDLPTGEIVKAHPNFRMIATCNIAYEGTNRLNKAFINRFEQVVNFENPTLDVLVDIIKSRTGYAKNDNIAKVLDVYTAMRKFSDEQNLDLVVSVRQLLTIFKQGRYYKTAREAVENIMVNGAFIEAPEYADLFKKTILTAFDLKFKI